MKFKQLRVDEEAERLGQCQSCNNCQCSKQSELDFIETDLGDEV